jgi:hypothetical protein
MHSKERIFVGDYLDNPDQLFQALLPSYEMERLHVRSPSSGRKKHDAGHKLQPQSEGREK